jgi:hypothetical protein
VRHTTAAAEVSRPTTEVLLEGIEPLPFLPPMFLFLHFANGSYVIRNLTQENQLFGALFVHGSDSLCSIFVHFDAGLDNGT